MGYTGGGPTPKCGVLRVARAGLQEDEARARKIMEQLLPRGGLGDQYVEDVANCVVVGTPP